MKVLVTGVKGQLGHDVMNELALRGIEGFGVDVEEMDITDRTACETVISQEKPDAVIHCAAYTAVDAAEDNLELCRKINAEGTRNIARVCKAMDIKMMYISTDYVFNGGGERPWEPDDHREPLNVYGLTKYEGEIAVEQNVQKYFIVRIAWVFGVNGKNFIKTMLRLGTRNIARVCKAMDIKMMYISTDYVFNGGGERPWEPDDHREPLNVYGLTKYEGEIAVEQNVQKYFIVRIAWVFGVNGKNFIKTMLRLGKEKGAVSVVDDQIGSPTYTYDLARLLVDMIQTDKYGRYHATNEGLCSWYEFACEIFRQAGMDEVKVTPVDSDGFPAKAKRPSNSRMSKEKLTENGFERLPSWQNALERYLKALKENGMA